MSITKENIASVKGRGFLLNRGTECFSGRVVKAGGVYSARDLAVIAECAERFGSGKVAFTSRQCAEIVGIHYDCIEAAEAYLAENGLAFGGTGAKVRPITACKGTTCVYGNVDTAAIAAEVHERIYVGMREVKLPHKFKIGIGGCPNSCIKPSLNDVGLEGCAVFEYDVRKCRGCAKCAVSAACPSKAVSVSDKCAVLDSEKCRKCGVCVGKCPFGAFPKSAESALKIYVGGTWGKTKREGTCLSFTMSPDEAVAVIEKVMLWYKDRGFAKERLGQTLDRVGTADLERALLSDELTARREEILAAPVKESV